MNTSRIFLLLSLILVQPAMAGPSELEVLREAAQNARQTMDATADKMDLLVAEIDTGELSPTSEPTVDSAEPVAESPESVMETAEDMVESTEPVPEASESVEVEGNAEPVQIAGSVPRAAFTTDIQDREPVDELQEIDNSVSRVFFFTELQDLEGQQVTHRWLYQGEVMGEVMFQVGGPRWRVNSSKNLMPEWIGTWEVEVLDGQGNRLVSRQLDVNTLSQSAAIQ